ncbi:MAG: neutral/alkaline non-lysosomal ceramidase N-terminal domain-containing protein [Chitinophagaceae bacterium]|nr:neutral/alkaline non-lysosomal ceramidase N-terminal domain-containing protein [Chitinophagaceae bacterium]
MKRIVSHFKAHPAKPVMLFFFCWCIVLFFPGNTLFAQPNGMVSKVMEAGVASVDITPDIPVRMAGYASRKSRGADSILHSLSAKALALGSDGQHPSILITVDLLYITWRITQQVSDFLSQEMGIDPAQIVICASHTHGGPELFASNVLQYRGDYFSDSLLALNQLIQIAEYTEALTQKLKNVAVAALKNRRPSFVSWGQGQALFAANRRTENGPVDVALPVLKVTDTDGSVRAVFLNYACHGTTLEGNTYKIHGDWIGEAQKMIEARHAGMTALIALGCAGDANPSPRGKLEHITLHGKEIADNVDKLLTASLVPLAAPPLGKMKWIKLPFSKLPTVPELIGLSKDKTVKGYNARRTLERVLNGEVIPASVDYPVQVWSFDDKMAMVNLAGEVVVDYSIRLKDMYGAENLWVNGYSNDVPCYIASRRVIGEGGYEGESSMYWYNKLAPLAPEAEDMIVGAVNELMPAVFREKRPVVNNQELVQKGEDNTYYLSAWQAGTMGKNIKYMPEWKAFGWFDVGDQAMWKVDIIEPGLYDVYFEWSVSDKEAGKSFLLQAGNKKLKGKISPTGSWFTYKTKKAGTIRLSAGIQEIVLKSGLPAEKGPLFDLRALTLVPVK